MIYCWLAATAPPSNLNAEQDGEDIRVTWTPTSDGDVRGYRIYYKLEPDGDENVFQDVNGHSANRVISGLRVLHQYCEYIFQVLTETTISDLNPDVTYQFQVGVHVEVDGEVFTGLKSDMNDDSISTPEECCEGIVIPDVSHQRMQ